METKRMNRTLSFENADCQSILSLVTEYDDEGVTALFTIQLSSDSLEDGEKNPCYPFRFSSISEIDELRDELYRIYHLMNNTKP